MSNLKKVGDLQIGQDMDFQKKEWSVERWGWILMLIIVAAALLGVFGQGPLSFVEDKNGQLKVTHGRFERLLAPIQYEVQVDPQAIKNGEARVQFSRDLLNYYTVQHIIPEPDSAEMSSDTITYVFKTGQDGQPGEITFNLQGQRIGMATGKIGLENGPSVNISQFIYP